jgi:hypothetical protein
MKYITIIAVLVAGLCTTAFNWHFSYALGRTEKEAYTWAIFSVALDVTKWTMLIVAVRAWPSLNSIAAILIWLTATAYSFTSAIGFASSNSFHQRVLDQQFRDGEASIASAKTSPLWRSTHACTDVTRKQSREFCDALKELEASHSTQPKEAPTTIFVTLFNVPPETASFLLSLYLALTCEIVSALGLFAALSPTRQRNSTWTSTQQTITPPSSSSAGTLTPNSPKSASVSSTSSSRRSWQKPRSWKST